MIKYFAVIIIALALIAGTFFIGKDYGAKGKEVECQKTVIVSQNEGIKTIAESTQSRQKVNAMPIDAVWGELFKRYCPDCK